MSDRRSGLRRIPPGHRPGGGCRRARDASADADERPGQDRTRSGAVHPPARSRHWLGRRRHHRLVDRGRRVRRDAECVQHRWGALCPRNWCDRAGHHDHRYDSVPGDHRDPGSVSAREARRRRSRRRCGGPVPCAVVHLRGRRLRGRRHRVHRRGRGGVRRSRRSGRVVLEPGDRRRDHPGRPRGQGHTAPGGSVAVARPRARRGHHHAERRARMGHQLDQGRLPGASSSGAPT